MAKTIFELLDCLTINKTEWEDTPEFTKNYNQFMINRFIGMQDIYLPIISEINQTKDLPNDVHYNFLKLYLPKKKIYFKYIKKDNNDVESLNAISTYFNISIDESKQIIEFLSKDDIEMLIEFNEPPKVTKNRKKLK